jgi:hypothetical protein
MILLMLNHLFFYLICNIGLKSLRFILIGSDTFLRYHSFFIPLTINDLLSSHKLAVPTIYKKQHIFTPPMRNFVT